MEDQIERLVQKAWRRYEETPPNQRLLIGIAGIPGSGKTTLAQIVRDRLQTRLAKANTATPESAVALAMDGFHLTRAELSAMSDPITAHARRGAAFTFNPAKYLDLIKALRATPPASGEPILAPTFDHAVKDPRDGDISVSSAMRIVIVEGLYLALDEPLWRDARALFDEVWFVEVDFEVARQRLRERHLRAGIVDTIEDGDKRAMENDLVNGRQIVDKRLPVDEVLQSREDGTWVHE